MTATESISMFNDMMATFPHAVISMVVSVSDNEDVTTTGLRTNLMTIRSNVNAGISENVDTSAWVLKSAFTDTGVLRGRPVVVIYEAVEKSLRILGTKEHALGGLVLLMLGEQDRVS